MDVGCLEGKVYKRPLDLGIIVVSHLVFLPVWLGIWIVVPLLIWLEDKGPVFYKQERAGKDGKPFTVLKFRTMIVDADKVGPAWTEEKDPRITKIGRVLRKTALDELPEVWSIFKGDMSFVGPRALNVQEQEQLQREIPHFQDRLEVHPGLTGMAQVYDLEDEDHTKLKYDLEYIDKMSFWLDLKLIALSVRNTIFARWDRRGGKGKKIGQVS